MIQHTEIPCRELSVLLCSAETDPICNHGRDTFTGFTLMRVSVIRHVGGLDVYQYQIEQFESETHTLTMGLNIGL